MTLVFKYIAIHYNSVKAASENTLLLPIIERFGRSLLSQRHFRRVALTRANIFLYTKVCDLGLHFGAKSSCPSNTQILETRPIIDGGRYSISDSSLVNQRLESEIEYRPPSIIGQLQFAAKPQSAQVVSASLSKS